MSAADPFEGTLYRDMTTAEDAVEFARYLSGEGGMHDPLRAIVQIDAAIHALTAARVKLFHELKRAHIDQRLNWISQNPPTRTT